MNRSNPPKVDNNKTPHLENLSRKRRRLFKVIAFFIIPLLVLLFAEVLLRVFGFGYNPRFTAIKEIEGVARHVANPRFGRRFFPPALNRSPTSFAIPVKKSETSYRVFVLGASAAQGVPNQTTSFSRILEVQLSHLYPETDFEIINTGITAINSHVVREVAKDCLGLEPDLFIVYLGNNEVVGPFGPGTVLSATTPKLPVIRLNVWLKKTRIGQLMQRLTELMPRGNEPSSWQGMAMFLDKQVRHDASAMTDVYHHFEKNLQDICQWSANQSVPVLLCPVAVNLKDNPPFASQHRIDLPDHQVKLWEKAWQSGIQKEETQQYQEAIADYLSAAELDDHYAELHFRLATCYTHLKDFANAANHYNLAKEYDTLRFRADDTINRVIRSIAQDMKSRGIHLVDIEMAVKEKSGHQLPGSEYFYEHVHFNFSGNYLVAATLTECLKKILPVKITSRPTQKKLLLTQNACAQRLAFTEWNRCQVAREVLDNYIKLPPFTHQAYHDAMLARWEKYVRDLNEATTDAVIKESNQMYIHAIRQNRADTWLRFNYGMFQINTLKNYKVAEDQMLYVLKKLPDEPSALLNLGAAFLYQNKIDSAISSFKKALDQKPHFLNAHMNLAKAYMVKQQLDGAIEQYKMALTLSPTSVSAYQELALALIEKQHFSEAIDTLQKLITTDPDNLEAYNSLGRVYDSLKRFDKAVEAYQKTITINPDFIYGYNNLGTTYHRMGDFDKAIEAYQQAITLSPDFAPAHLNLAGTYQANGDDALALHEYHETIRLEPDHLAAHVNLVKMMQKSGMHKEAVEHYQKMLDRKPDWLFALNGLARVLATVPDDNYRDPDRALILAEKLNRMTQKQNPFFLDTLAAAQAAKGLYAAAITTIQQALVLPNISQNPEMMKMLNEHLALYQTQKSLLAPED